ncbi:MAG: methyltransferase domain-containing protein [Pseudomonadota bacterium]
MSHVYSDTFFDYINESARDSAAPVTSLVHQVLTPRSVLDLGSGRGVWLDEWRRRGVQMVLGVDGDYVDQTALAIAPDEFMAADLTQPLNVGRRFDLAQCLEVGEHLPQEASVTLVASLTAASDRVLFSAAVPGQGGEFHINEQPLAYWQALFEARGYRAYDFVRPQMRRNRAVAPWYRYNTVLYANDTGRVGLPDAVLARQVPVGEAVQDGGDALWRLRRGVVSHLPRGAVTRIAQWRAGILAWRAQQQTRRSGLSA